MTDTKFSHAFICVCAVPREQKKDSQMFELIGLLNILGMKSGVRGHLYAFVIK